MVHIATIREHNRTFTDENHGECICVFVGATSGIGLATLKTMATMLYSSRFYIFGRAAFREELEALKHIGSSNEYVYIHVAVSLIAEVDAACEEILNAEKKVDYMCLSPGTMPWTGPICMTHRPVLLSLSL
jgi:NADP-dependent 3-hydroxy acid dehydrogenase YdfG